MNIFQSLHTPQSPHTGEVKICKVSTNHKAHTHWNFGKFAKSPHTTGPTHRKTLIISKSPHTTAQSTHRRILKIFKISTHHTTEFTHRGTLKIFKVSTVYPPKDWRFRTHNLKVPSFGESLKIPVCRHCAVVCRDFEYLQSSFVCDPCVVVCGDFEFFKVPLCLDYVLWCVGTLCLQFPLCVNTL